MSIAADGGVGFISPHFDDVALSAADAIGTARRPTLVTIFSGGPHGSAELAGWDAAAGTFNAGDDVIAMRTAEDDAALELVDGRGMRLGFWSGQYRPPAAPTLLARALVAAKVADPGLLERAPRLLAETISRLGDAVDAAGCGVWFVPLGLGHRDHRLTAAACAAVAARRPALTWYAYEDLPYAVEGGAAALTTAKRRYVRAGLSPGEIRERQPSVSSKTRLLDCYPSQLVALGERVQVATATPERYWRLRPAV